MTCRGSLMTAVIASRSWCWLNSGTPVVGWRRRPFVGLALVAVVGAGALHAVELHPMSISVGQPSEADSVARLIADVAPNAGPIMQPRLAADGAYRVSSAAGVLTLPSTLREPITWTGGAERPVTLVLPRARGQARVASDGTVVYGIGSGAELAVQMFRSGGIRTQSVVRSSDAPHSFSYDFGPSVSVVPNEEGGAELRRLEGGAIASIGRLDAPWAKDADGRVVPTRYVFDGSVVTQEVLASSGHRYPIVADPFWIPVLGVMAHFGSHVLRQMAARKISQELVEQVVLNGRRTRGNEAGTSVFTQGSGSGKIRVVVNDKTGKIITATKG
jgi:hypothetical protein